MVLLLYEVVGFVALLPVYFRKPPPLLPSTLSIQRGNGEPHPSLLQPLSPNFLNFIDVGHNTMASRRLCYGAECRSSSPITAADDLSGPI